MGDVKLYQLIRMVASKVTESEDDPAEIDFEMPAEELEDDTYNEDLYGRFAVPALTTDMNLSFGSVGSATLLAIYADSELTIKIKTAAVPSPTQAFVLVPGRWSVFHAEITGLLLTNASATETVKGRYFVAGDND